MSNIKTYTVYMKVSVPIEMDILVDSDDIETEAINISDRIEHQIFNGVLADEVYESITEHEEYEVYGYKVFLTRNKGLIVRSKEVPELSRALNKPAFLDALADVQRKLNASGIRPDAKD